MSNTTAQRTWNFEIQILRGVAILLVLGFHFGLPIPGGFLGVDIFFVISGYLMARIFFRQLETSGKIDVREFAKKRFSRIFPAMGAMIAAVAAASILLLSPAGPQQDSSMTGLGAVFGVPNIAAQAMVGGYFDIPAIKNVFLHLWSIGVELQFYLFLALTAVIANRANTNRVTKSVLVRIVVFFGIFSLVSALVPTSTMPAWIPQSVFGYFSPVPRLWEFAFGFLIFWLPKAVGKALRSHKRLSSFVGIALILSMIFVDPGADYRPGIFAIPAVLGSGLIILSKPFQSNAHKAAVGRLFLTLGKYSYSLYLWHWPLLGLAITSIGPSAYAPPIALVMTLFLAVGSFHLIEKRFHFERSQRNENGKSQVALGAIAPLLASSLLLVGSSSSWWDPGVKELQVSALSSHIAVAHSCDQMLRNSRALEECVLAEGAEGNPLVLVGDSHADHISEGLLDISKQENRPLHLLIGGGCPYLGVNYERLDKSSSWNTRCKKATRDIGVRLATFSESTIIFSISPHYFFESVLAFDVNHSQERQDSDFEFFERAIGSEIAKWVDAGNTVFLMGAVPRWDGKWEWDPTSCTVLDIRGSRCNGQAPLQEIGAQAERLNQVYESLSSERENVHHFLLSEPICPNNLCSVEINGNYLWRDASHLSIDGGVLAISSLFENYRSTALSN